jgi:hypothetical protein
LVSQFIEPKVRKQLLCPCQGTLLALFKKLQKDQEVFYNGQVLKEGVFLWQKGYALLSPFVGRQMGDVLSFQLYGPIIHRQKAHQTVKQGGFTRPIGTQ